MGSWLAQVSSARVLASQNEKYQALGRDFKIQQTARAFHPVYTMLELLLLRSCDCNQDISQPLSVRFVVVYV